METHEIKGIAHYLGATSSELALLIGEPVKDVQAWLEGDVEVPEFIGFVLRQFASGVRKTVMAMKKDAEGKSAQPMIIVFDKYEDIVRFRAECDEQDYVVNAMLTKRIGKLTNAEVITFDFESFIEFSEHHPVGFDEDGLMEWALRQVA